jgi:hypothetical protein
MRGIKGFRPDSNYGLCLRYIMFLSCQTIENSGTDDFRLSILVEDGPWAAGAANVYSRVSRMTGKWKPAKHAHRLDDFAIARKGATRCKHLMALGAIWEGDAMRRRTLHSKGESVSGRLPGSSQNGSTKLQQTTKCSSQNPFLRR